MRNGTLGDVVSLNCFSNNTVTSWSVNGVGINHQSNTERNVITNGSSISIPATEYNNNITIGCHLTQLVLNGNTQSFETRFIVIGKCQSIY